MNENETINAVENPGFFPGAIVDTPDERDYHFGEQLGGAAQPFDWDKGFDIEEEVREAIGDINFKLPIKDQNGSFSCGGQAQSAKTQVLAALHNKKFVESSAKYPYAQVYVGTGGSAGRDLCNIAIKQGFGPENETVSYENGQPPHEAFMERKEDITNEAKLAASVNKAAIYADVAINIDIVAEAIRDTGGVILGIYGINNGTWRSKFPIPGGAGVNPARDLWAHWVYAGKAKLINGKKYIGFQNSWGVSTGEQGWQYISEDYFTAKWGMFQIWTFVYDANPPKDSPFHRTIVFGMHGDDVKAVQEGINMPLEERDGKYGKKTLAAVKVFQSLYGLKVDGVVGPKTQAQIIKNKAN